MQGIPLKPVYTAEDLQQLPGVTDEVCCAQQQQLTFGAGSSRRPIVNLSVFYTGLGTGDCSAPFAVAEQHGMQYTISSWSYAS